MTGSREIAVGSQGTGHTHPGGGPKGGTAQGRSLRRSALVRRLWRPRLVVSAALLLAAVGGASTSTGQAAGVNPLPIVAKALNGVNSYQVVVSSTSSGGGQRPSGTPRPRPSGTPGPGRGQRGLGFGFGPQTRTITAVRKSGNFEEYVVITGKDRSGKPFTNTAIIYGNRICVQMTGARTYTCQTTQNAYSVDPTAAFVGGAGSTVFTAAPSKQIGGQACDGYTYSNTSTNSTATGVVYIGHATGLPCEQDSTVVRHFGGGSGSFTQKSTAIWSRFNDKRLTVPAVPA